MGFEWLEAGFFITSTSKSIDRTSLLLPAATISTCIVETYPDLWAMPWVNNTPEEILNLQGCLGLEGSEIKDLRSWVARALSEAKFGWPNVFLSLRSAREFRHRFLGAIQDTRLVGLSLAKEVAAAFLREEGPQEGRSGSGVWAMLTRDLPLQQNGSLLGFDVLGAEYGGDFHTFSCNGLGRDFNEKLGITFNKFGLIDDYLQAVDACEYANRDDVPTEPVAWYPFRVDNYTVGDHNLFL